MEEKNKELRQKQKDRLEDAIVQYREAAQEGDARAQYGLARTYYQYNEYGKSFYWWEKSAENGLNAACMRVAVQCAYGIGTEKDENKALDYIWRAVKGDPDDTDALCYLGMFYEEGIGVEVSMEQAMICYQQAAEKGSGIACFTIAMAYFYGNNMEEDTQAALEWANKAAELNYEEAQYFLGLQYYLGDRVERDLDQSLKYLRSSVENGSKDGQQLLPVVAREISVEAQMRDVTAFQQMLDQYEAYMMQAAEKMGFADEEEEE